MAMYELPTWDPTQVARVGWDRAQNTYWFMVYKRSPFGETSAEGEITYQGGMDEPWRLITNVGDLLLLTWGEIKWESTEGVYVARMLRDDAVFEAIYNDDTTPGADLDNFVVHAFDVRAIMAAEIAVGLDPQAVPPPPAAIRNEVPKPLPTSTQRVPSSRRRFLRRRGA